MIIEVENLGPIKRGKIELKPLTVFIGPNNTGKTYLAYLIAGITNKWRIKVVMRKIMESIVKSVNEKKMLLKITEDDFRELLKSGVISKEIDLKDFILNNEYLIRAILKELSLVFNNVSQRFVKEHYWRFLGSDVETLVKNAKIHIEFPDFDVEKNLKIFFKNSIDTERMGFVKIRKESNTYKLHIDLDLKMLLELDVEEVKKRSVVNILLNYTLLEILIELIVYPLSAIVRIFPAQRNTLMLDFIKSAINIATREEQEGTILLNEENELPEKQKMTIHKPEKLIKSKPILNFLKLTDWFIPSKDKKSNYYDLGSKLENILGGNVVIAEDGDIRFKIDKDTSLKLTVSSSMVQQLSPLALYLKHLAEFGDLIIIDEPESNLHPEAQKKVVEIIAEMVNRGLWVIITTHSPFIIDYLNTLMKAYKVASISNEAKKQVLEVIKNESALLNPENVGVYLFTKDGLIENVKKDYIINLESFRRIIDEIGAMFTELLIIEDIYQKSVGETDDATD